MDDVKNESEQPSGKEPVGLDQTIFPFEYSLDGENLLYEAPFRFEVDDQVLEGRMQIRIDGYTTHPPGEIPIIPFALTTGEYIGYLIDGNDRDLEARREKLNRFINNQSGFNYGNSQLLSIRLLANFSEGFTPAQEAALRKIHAIVGLSDLAIINHLEGNVTLPEDVRKIYANSDSSLIYVDKGTKKLSVGEIYTFYPLDLGPLAHDHAFSSIDNSQKQEEVDKDGRTISRMATIGPGHTVTLPTNAELLQPTNFTFIQSKDPTK